MNPLVIAIGFGTLGGLLRILVTTLNTVRDKQKIQLNGMILYAIVMLAVGAFSGIVLGYGKVLSFLGGYAGIDFLDGLLEHIPLKKTV